MKKTIKERIEEILLKKGYVDNYYAIDSRITTRLSDTIFNLQKEGWEFDEEKSGYIGDTKNWRYVAKKSPYKIIKYTLPSGAVIEKITK